MEDNRIRRVQQHEQELDMLLSFCRELSKVCEAFPEAMKGYHALNRYMHSGEYMEDFEADARGEFPQDLRRGVLSEDGAYNALEEADAFVKCLEGLLRNWKAEEERQA